MPEMNNLKVENNVYEVADKIARDNISALEENGAKNLLQSYGDTQESDGVTFTKQSDGTYILSGTATGSPSAFAILDTSRGDIIDFDKAKKYILSCGVTGSLIGLGLFLFSGGSLIAELSTRTGGIGTVEIDASAYSYDRIIVYIEVSNGTACNNVVIKPMIRDARITDPTYVPYAMPNSELTQEISGVWDSINGVYIGRDLTVVFADEIANYSDEWAWIQARLNAHNVSGLRVGDYIPIKVGTETHKAEIAGINTYRRTGDGGHEVGYHIDWITRDCYSQTVQFNTTNINNGKANNPNPFLASNLKSWLDGTLYPLLETKLKAVIKSKRILAPYRYQSGATLTDDNSWGWEDFTKLWVPLETEIFDCLVWSTKSFGNGQAVQYPIFANSYEHRMKGAGPGGARANWWTASASSGTSTHVVYVYYNGNSTGYGASSTLHVPVCFRTMEA